MQKLMKNWIFTMITCILLLMFAVLMVLDGLDVGGLHIGDRLIHLLAAIALVIYVVFALFPLVMRYRGVLRGFVIGEVTILLVTALAQLFTEWVNVPLISSMQVCSVLGLAMWLRGVVQTVRAYLSGVGEGAEPRIPLWKLLLYVLLSTLGVWQLAAPSIADKTFILVIGLLAGVMGVIFACITYHNRKESAPERAAKKQVRMEKKAALLKAKEAEQMEEDKTKEVAMLTGASEESEGEKV